MLRSVKVISIAGALDGVSEATQKSKAVHLVQHTFTQSRIFKLLSTQHSSLIPPGAALITSYHHPKKPNLDSRLIRR